MGWNAALALLNLCVNAADVMPRGGDLTISTANCVLDSERNGLPAGRFVEVRVADTGKGVSDAIKDKLFEPFFTTKPEGHGTGLGLSTCFGIVKQAGGAIDFVNNPGPGATFKIQFPVTDKSVPHVRSLHLRSQGEGNETILVVEDLLAVRKVLLRVLSRSGYRVLEAPNGAVALELMREHSHELDLLITDVVMPELNGPELAHQVRRQLPQLPILFLSGFAEHSLVEEILGGAQHAFRNKTDFTASPRRKS